MDDSSGSILLKNPLRVFGGKILRPEKACNFLASKKQLLSAYPALNPSRFATGHVYRGFSAVFPQLLKNIK
jgi:hypothetical protein